MSAPFPPAWRDWHRDDRRSPKPITTHAEIAARYAICDAIASSPAGQTPEEKEALIAQREAELAAIRAAGRTDGE